MKLFASKKTRFNIGIIILMAIMLEVISAVQYYYSRDLLEEELEHRIVTSLLMKTNSLRQTLHSVEQTMDEHLWNIQQNLHQPDSMFTIARRLLNNEKVVGCCLAFVPDYYPQKGKLFEPYAFKDENGVKVEQLGGKDDHDYTLHPAFLKMQEHKEPFWSDPYNYETEKGTQALTTYSYPLLNGQGELIAVCGLDMSLSWLGETLNAQHIYKSSFDLFLTNDGQLITGPSEEMVGSKRVKQAVRILNDSLTKHMDTFNERVKYTQFYDEEKDDQAYIYYIRMQGNPEWQVALVCYEGEVYGKLLNLRLYVILLMLATFLLLGFITHRDIRNMMRLQQAKIEQQRISSELAIAQDIQREMLPKKFPPYPERNDMDIFGLQVPAREVGGDLFDFFLRDEKLFFCIGDVSGKGVPSAMIMTQTHSLFRMASARENNPASIMQRINEVMLEGNESNMFITAFIGILDLPTGHLRYCNAGHDKPILVGREKRCQPLAAKANMPLGIFNDIKYVMQEEHLATNTMLFLYTDGLTEAKNTQRKMFGVERVLNTLTQEDGDCQQMVVKMKEAVEQFTEGAEQSDDLTILAIRYLHHDDPIVLDEHITLNCDLKEIRLLNDFVKGVTARLGIEKGLARKLQLAVEEAVSNVMSYAYPTGQEGQVGVTIHSNGHRIKIIISDNGVAFDPTEAAWANTTLSAEERPIGGLGILLVRKMMDSVNYERSNGKNILTLRKDYGRGEQDHSLQNNL
jgi:sigma-B regulation protein RsbU (phosphoserine phosphatase)